MIPSIRESMLRTSASVNVPEIASPEMYPAVPSIRVITVPARTVVLWAVPVGIPIVPLFVNVSFTKILKPFVNNVTLAFTVNVL